MRNLSFCRKLAIAMVLVILVGMAYAANTNGRIEGVVTDPQGSVVSSAKITATNNATGVKYETVSASDGAYQFAELPIGSYTVTASVPAFKSFTATGIVLNIDQDYVENIKLVVGSANEMIEVSASALQVDTTDMQISNVVNSEQMRELPLINRAFTGLELTLPGVQAPNDRFTGNYSVSGAQSQQSSYLINGADTNDIALNTIIISPSLDAIDQFNLIEGPLNAEYDRNSGGIVSATIKQGANQFHGDAFEFYRDTFLNTANFFQHTLASATAPSKAVVATFHQNIFGGTVGGPILRDKLFFFSSYQGTRQVVPQTGGNVGVYSAPMLNGDFSVDNPATAGTEPTTPAAGTCPASATWGSFGCNPIPSSIASLLPNCDPNGTWAQCAFEYGGKFPTSAFNTVAKGLQAKYIPAPNSGSSYVFSPVTTTTNDQYIGRADYALNPANQIYGLFIIAKQKSPETLPFSGGNLPGFGDHSTTSTNQITLEYVHQFSATAVNDFAAHYTRFNFDTVEPLIPVSPASAGFDISPQDTKGDGLPLLAVTGLNGINFALGFSSNGPQPRIDQTIQLDDNLSKIFGRHNLKFGYDGRRFNVSNPFFGNNNGHYTFNPSSSQYSTGDGALDFLLGIPGTYAQGSGATIQASAFLNYVYGQDSWKLTNTLTVNYGLAYSIDTPLHNNQFDGLGILCLNPGVESGVFPTAPLGAAYPGDGACSNSGLAKTRYNELAPRIGFAWTPNLGMISGGPGKFSIRGGFGIYYDRTEEESALQTLETPPFGLGSEGVTDVGGSPSLVNPYQDINGGPTIANKFPYAFPVKGQTISPATWSALEPLGISTFGSSFRAPYAENFQFSVERELPSQMVARLSYVGSLGRRNQVTYEGNAETPAGHAACLAGAESSLFTTDSCVSARDSQSFDFPQNTLIGTADTAHSGIDPNTGFTGITSAGTVGSFASSSYHALQALLRKDVTHGLLFELSYTYSHALDTGSGFENAEGGANARGFNQYVPSLNFGDSLSDARQRLVFSPVYVIPHFSGSNYSLRNLAIAGWEISGITTVATGQPYDISYSGASSNSLYCSTNFSFYNCPDVPNQVAPATFGNLRIRQGTGNSVYLTNAQSNAAGNRPGFTTGAAAFSAEAIGTFGDTHRDLYHGPGINNTNMILAKNFTLNSERNISLQMRMESDNVFNHTQFGNPTSNYTSSNFGVVTTAAAARQTQLAAKVYF